MIPACPICRRSEDMVKEGADLVCYAPKCIYARTLAASAKVLRRSPLVLKKGSS